MSQQYQVVHNFWIIWAHVDLTDSSNTQPWKVNNQSHNQIIDNLINQTQLKVLQGLGVFIMPILCHLNLIILRMLCSFWNFIDIHKIYLWISKLLKQKKKDFYKKGLRQCVKLQDLGEELWLLRGGKRVKSYFVGFAQNNWQSEYKPMYQVKSD